MNSKTKFVFLSVFALLGLGIAAGSTVVDFGGEAWSDKPMYMEDAELDLEYSNMVQTKEKVERCVDSEMNESTGEINCLDRDKVTVPDETVRPIKFRKQDFEYLGNGEVKISFEARVNQELVGAINSGKFRDTYLVDGERPTKTEYDEFVSGLSSVSFSSTESSKIKDRQVSSSNVNAGWQKMTFIVAMEDFRSGGLTLSDHSSIKLETMNTNGGN